MNKVLEVNGATDGIHTVLYCSFFGRIKEYHIKKRPVGYMENSQIFFSEKDKQLFFKKGFLSNRMKNIDHCFVTVVNL